MMVVEEEDGSAALALYIVSISGRATRLNARVTVFLPVPHLSDPSTFPLRPDFHLPPFICATFVVNFRSRNAI